MGLDGRKDARGEKLQITCNQKEKKKKLNDTS